MKKRGQIEEKQLLPKSLAAIVVSKVRDKKTGRMTTSSMRDKNCGFYTRQSCFHTRMAKFDEFKILKCY